MKKSTKQKIKKYVNLLQVEIFKDKHSFPINIEDIIIQLGGEIIDYDLEYGVLAEIISSKKDNFTIKIINDISKEKRKFLLAKQLGHLFLHLDFLKGNSKISFKDNISNRIYPNRWKHLQAYEFAKNFLMPEKEFRKVAQMNLNGHKYNTKKIAEYFKVSLNKASYRGKQLGLFRW